MVDNIPHPPMNHSWNKSDTVITNRKNMNVFSSKPDSNVNVTYHKNMNHSFSEAQIVLNNDCQYYQPTNETLQYS